MRILVTGGTGWWGRGLSRNWSGEAMLKAVVMRRKRAENAVRIAFDG